LLKTIRLLPSALSFLLALALPLSARADTPHSKVPVTTSRGEFPLHVYTPRADSGRPLVLLLSGEGGWRSFDQRLAAYFQDEGFWVGGIDCLKYFWKAQDDRRALAADIRSYADVLARAAGRAKNAPVLLAGFSFGADLAPWVAGGEGWGSRVAGLLMFGPDAVGSLEFRVLEIMGFEQHDHIFQVSDALASIGSIPVVFIYGGADNTTSAVSLAQKAPCPKKLLMVPAGDHHFNGKEAELQHALKEGIAWLLKLATAP